MTHQDRRAARALSGLLLGMGTLHFVAPRVFDETIPKALGSPRSWVYGSGLAELLCGAMIINPSTRKTGARAAAALFVAVFPANVQMALDGGATRGKQPTTMTKTFSYARLPLQAPLIAWALRVSAAA